MIGADAMDELLLRLLWAAAILGGGLGLFWAANRWTLGRAKLQLQKEEIFPRGKPSVLYFTTPTCQPCKTVQRPALRRLQEQAGEKLQVIEVDASKQPELASQWGVMSVPTTFIIDEKGEPCHVNHGVATFEKLQKQLKDL
jgi:thiol-disulfide isomerase/thioredoxin